MDNLHQPSRDELFVGVAAITTVYVIQKVTKSVVKRRRLNQVVKRRQQEREESIEWARKTFERTDIQRRREIGTYDFDTLRSKLQSGEVLATEALHTYQWKALEAHGRTNCITLYINEATGWASELDRKASEPGYVKGPLHGMPVSLKECVPVKGYDQTRGYVQECYVPSKHSGVLVDQIVDLGGVPFVQTNVPQSLLAYSCTNPIYGVTNQPDHKDRTPGGSSGGESALIGAGGSLLGIGGDVGGSIRFPCHFCGISGFKPSHLRFSHKGVVGSVPGRPLINASDGPMAPDLHTCVEFLKAVWADDYGHNRDPYVVPVRWNAQLFEKGRKYKIGFYTDDGWFTPTPACQRAVLEAKAILEELGHTVVPFQPPRIRDVFSLFIGAVCVDGGNYLLGKMNNDIMDERYKASMALYRFPFWVQTLLSYLLRPIYPRMAHALVAMPRTTTELRLKYAAIEEYRFEFCEQMREAGVDAILCPAAVVTAPHHDVPTKLIAGITYTGTYNLLDFAAGVVPITKINEADDKALADYPTSDPWYRLAKKTTQGAIGLPVGVQVTAPPYKEELCLRILQDIEDYTKEHHK